MDEAALEDQQSNQSHIPAPEAGASSTLDQDDRPDVPLQVVPADLDPEEDKTLQKVSRCSALVAESDYQDRDKPKWSVVLQLFV